MSGERLFGTDGVRGVANVDLTAPLALQLGMAAGHWARQAPPPPAPPESDAPAFRAPSHEARLAPPRLTPGRPFVIIGRDTRLSGDMLEAALAAGLAAMGVDVVNVGIVPTPAVAQIVLARGAAAGVVLSASHNPYDDNGIKFFGSNGKKLPDSVEDEIEATLGRLDSLPRHTGGDIGRIVESREPVAEYVTRVMATLRGAGALPLGGLRLVMDCANGAAYEIAPQIFRELGAELTLLHAEPDGININVQCGSTKPQEMAAKVREVGAHAGLAFDGDADRVMLADENGEIVDGDRMMAILALHLHALGRLPGDVVVATIMSNVGLEQALGARGIRLHRTDVGDRYVAEAMESLGAAVGGEQSGHILLPQLTPTGDGLVTALQVLAILRETGQPLSALAGVVQTCPQLLKNVRVRTKQGWREDADIQRAIAAGREKLGSPEWLSVRPSGTEPLIRVMAQGTEREVVEAVVHDICAVVEQKLGRESGGY
ncbi:MAG TPA: phosphoglucosamine mutase [Chthonomonadaceae bacterium]|nr:phosphoglucosamine mutase [Chthonomonadaceae bacterium]